MDMNARAVRPGAAACRASAAHGPRPTSRSAGRSRRTIILLLATAACSAAAAQSCGPSQLGNPCAQGDVASQGGLQPEADLGIGNPVHLATGNKYLFEEDLPALPLSPLLTVARHYNSLDPRHGPLGRGWMLNYDTRLYAAGQRIQIVQADGSRVDFPAPGPQAYSQTPRGRLYRRAQGWSWLWPNGQSLDFDAQGRLSAVRAAIPRPGEVRVQRHATGLLSGLIASLRDEQGHEIRLNYRIAAGQAYLDSLDAPQGRWQYHYGGAGAGQGLRLTAAEGPDGMQRRYLYEAARQSGNPWLPTGIALARGAGASAIRLRTWHYDAQGRVVQAWQASADAVGAMGEEDPADGVDVAGTAGIAADTARATVSLSYAVGPGPERDGRTQLRTAGGRHLTLRTRITEGRYTLPAATLSLGRGSADAPEGWPELSMHYDAAGRRTHWHSPLTGRQALHYDAQGRLERTESAGGAQWHYHYDDRHRLVDIRASRGNDSQQIRLHWQQERLTGIEHPSERERLIHDSQGRLVQRDVSRPALSGTGQLALRYRESFEYDALGRLTVHHLPEGGSLHYRWSATQRLTGLDWRDRQGRRHTVLHGIAGRPGYEHGNGLHTVSGLHGDKTFSLTVMDGDTPVWVHLRRQDAEGRVTHVADWHGRHRTGRGWRLHYDRASRLARAIPVILPPAWTPGEPLPALATAYTQRASMYAEWYAWHADGGLAARRHQGASRKPDIERDAGGLPRRVGEHRLRYGATGRLEQVADSQGREARYTHNAHGYRISARYGAQRHAAHRDAALDTATGARNMQYLYVGHKLAAEIDTRVHHGADAGVRASAHADAARPHDASGPLAGRHVTRRYLYAGQTLVGFIDYGPDAPDGEPYAVHADPLGTPRLVTDARRRVRWLADYSPTGESLGRWGDLDFAMRLPGQIADPFTGWHDNLLRTYAPELGAYLEPDPLGPLPNQQALGYARQQPQRYIDPTGLLLFAFDGTRQAALTRANVWKMNQRYADGPAYYHAGPGNPYYMDNDALVASQADRILDTQWQRLLDALHAAPRRRNPGHRPHRLFTRRRAGAPFRQYDRQPRARRPVPLRDPRPGPAAGLRRPALHRPVRHRGAIRPARRAGPLV